MENRIIWLHETGWGGRGPRRKSGLIDSSLPTCPGSPVPPGVDKGCFLCSSTSSSCVPNSFLPQRPSDRPKPVRGPEGQGWSQSDIRVSKPDGPSKMGIKIPSNFLMVGWASGQKAERTCFLHVLVMCLLPRAEVIQETPWKPPGATPGQVMTSVLLPSRTGGALGTYAWEGSSLQLHLSSLPRDQGTHGEEDQNPVSSRCSQVSEGLDWRLCSLLPTPSEGRQAESRR